MKRLSILIGLGLFCTAAFAQKINWVYSTNTQKWIQASSPKMDAGQGGKPGITVYPDAKLQSIEGFGGCFNEIGWEALSSLPEAQRGQVLKDLFSKEGANFTLCRVPVGANDYSFSYYSYNDVPEDFGMRNFNIGRDRYILIPYIKAAKQIAPGLKIWGSPWSPPAWMKVNNHYAMSHGGNDEWGSDMPAAKRIANNATAFKREDRYLEAYALYLSRYVQAYGKAGIHIVRLCVQNEIVYQPHWRSCTWRAEDIAFFIGKFLGPRFKTDSVRSEIWLGTVNSAAPALFNFNKAGAAGGYADVNDFVVDEPQSKGLMKPIPYNQTSSLISLADGTVLASWNGLLRPVAASDNKTAGKAAQFKVLDRGNDRIALQSVATGGFVTVKGLGGRRR